ncbi:sensor histidine kinase [Actinoplanes sp. NPDC049265]|uniref:sensor histidine kinase n=1 Tax=Actinoplanes sp. NPDC049265 TaxID=3363902 RepID=UPI00371B0549
MNIVARWVREIFGVLVGGATALGALVFFLGAGLLWAVPAGRRWVRGGARQLAVFDRSRVNQWLGGPHIDGDVEPARAAAYLALHLPVGLLGGLVVILYGWGAITVALLVLGWFIGQPVDDIPPTPLNVIYILGAAAFLAFLGLQGLLTMAGLDRALAARFLVPSDRVAYERRIAELSTARAEVVAAVDAERRRIERDLHDGVQQRLVALGLLLGRARRAQPDRVPELLRQAHGEAADALSELREVSWRVFPAALDAGGLPAALETVADRSPVRVRLAVELDDRPVSAVETVAYFVVCEAVTNAVKHAGAAAIDVAVRRHGGDLHVRVADDGSGGADPAGGGLTGLARRVSALDGRFSVQSPAGGPTTIAAVLPCA